MALLTCLWGPVPRALTRPGYVRGIWSRVAALRTGLRARCDASGDVVPPVRGVRVLRRGGGAAWGSGGLVGLVAARVVMRSPRCIERTTRREGRGGLAVRLR